LLLETLSPHAFNVWLTKQFTRAATQTKGLHFQNPTHDLGYLRKPHRRRAFPIGELKHSCAIQVLIATGLTLWLLEEPGRVWPWFALGWACLAAACIAILEIQEGTLRDSLTFSAFSGAPLAWTGWVVQSRGYPVLGWICIGSAALFVVALIVRCILAAWPRNSNP